MLATVLLLPIILSAVSAVQYGLWLVLVSVGSLLYYADFGVGLAILHFSSRIRAGGGAHTCGELLSAGLLWNASVSLLVVPSYFILGSLYVESNADSIGLSRAQQAELVLCGTVVVAGLVIRPFTSALAGAGYLPVERRNQGIAVVFKIVATPLVCWLTPSIVAIAAVETTALLLPHALSGITIAILGQHRIRWHRATLDSLKYMLSYSTRASIYNFVESALLQGGTVAAGLLSAPADATYYNAAYRVYSSVRQLLGWILDPLRPGLSRLYAIGRRDGDAVVHAVSRVLISVSVLGGLSLIIGGQALIGLWLGQDVPTAMVSATSAILLSGLILNSIHLPLAVGAYALGRPAAFIIPQVIWCIAFIGLAGPFSSKWGIVGIAMAFASPLLLLEPVYLIISRNALGFNLRHWLLLDVTPVAYPALCGMLATSVFIVVIGGLHSGVASAVAMFIFIGGSAIAFLLRPSTVPVNSLRTIFRTEL